MIVIGDKCEQVIKSILLDQDQLHDKQKISTIKAQELQKFGQYMICNSMILHPVKYVTL